MDILTVIVPMLLVCVCATEGFLKKTETTGIVYINETTSDLQGSHGAMPDSLNITVEPPGLGAAEELKLKKSAIDINAPVFVICGDGRSICRQHLDNIQDFALYQDSASNVAISVAKEPRADGTKRVKMEGSILMKDVQYFLEDLGEDQAKDQTGNASSSLPYRLTPLDVQDVGQTDFKVLDKPMEYEKLKGRFRRQVDGNYGVELLPVIDYKIYDTWYQRSKVSNPVLRDMDTKNNIRKYFAHVVNGMDLRYRGIQANDFQIYIRLAGYVIADKPNFSPWTTGTGNTGEIDADRALDRFFDWRRVARDLPVHDHATLFTGQDLYTLSSRQEKLLSVTGYAYLGRICNELSVSIVEDQGGFGCVKTATHELGHSLGANHDGDKNACVTGDQYIMAGSSVPTNNNNKLNPWKFSPCSIQAFRAKMQSLDRFAGNCLSNQARTANPREWDAHLSRHPGQLFQPDDICIQVLGPSSYMCRDLLPTDAGICTSLWCHINGTNQCRQYVPPRGTTCGSQKWCLSGVCEVDRRAPIIRGGCTFGDQPGIAYQGETCAQIVASKPRYCYESFIRQRCCESCAKVFTSVEGCEYGNRQGRCESWWCTLTNQDAATVRRQCCQTCNVGRLLPSTRPTTLVPPIVTKDTGQDGKPTQSPVPAGCKDNKATCGLDVTILGEHVCYTQEFYSECCRSCEGVRQQIPGCEYGSRDPSLCSAIDAPDQCRRRKINSECCRECSAFQVRETQTSGGRPGPRPPPPALLLLLVPLIAAVVWSRS